MNSDILQQLEPFIVRAKSHTYMAGGEKLLPYRLGSKDLQYNEDDWAYHDSYFGDADFSGQEVVYYQGRPVWAQNYFGYLFSPEKITAAQTSEVIRQSLLAMYKEGRFLGGFTHACGGVTYVDTSEGDVFRFRGQEWISRGRERLYELVYHGGVIR